MRQGLPVTARVCTASSASAAKKRSLISGMTSSALPRHAPNLALAFRETVREHESEVAVRTLDGSVEWTWGELGHRVDALAGGLRTLGVGRGATVAIMLVNRPEFHLADLAVVTAGGTPFSIYQTYTPDQIAYVVSDSGARVIITDRARLESYARLDQVLDGADPAATAFGPTGAESARPEAMQIRGSAAR